MKMQNRLAPPPAPPALPDHPWIVRPVEASTLPTMRTMTTEEIDSFVSSQGFGVLALSDENRAYGVPLFYGSRDDIVYFQTRAGKKSRYLYATTEACLVISAPMGQGQWASVQLIGQLERVDAHDSLDRVPAPLLWADGDERSNASEEITTFRLVPARRIGRYSQPASQAPRDRELGYVGT